MTTPNPAPNIVGHDVPVSGTGNSVGAALVVAAAVARVVAVAVALTLLQLQFVEVEQLGFLQKP